MFEHDSDLKAHALRMWGNYIETGDVLLSAQDAHGRNRSLPPRAQIKIQPLSTDQTKLVARLRQLAAQELKSRIG
jgi:hypothetical protein